MTLQHWRRQVIEELKRQGLPEGNVDRLVEELTDHAIDLLSAKGGSQTEENLDRRLGSPQALAAFAKSEFKKNGFVSRHPLLVFLIGPIVAVYGSLFGIIFATEMTAWFAGLIYPGIEQNPIASLEQAAVAYRICQAVSLSIRFMPFLLSSWIFAKLSFPNGLRVWGVVTCGIVAASAFYLESVATLQTQPDNRVFVICNVISTPDWNLTQVTQAVVPLLMGVVIYCQSEKRAAKRVFNP